jgi:hypothetical protein
MKERNKKLLLGRAREGWWLGIKSQKFNLYRTIANLSALETAMTAKALLLPLQ